MKTHTEDLGSASQCSSEAVPSTAAAAPKQIRRRFIIEGEWSGYTSRQQRIVHRQVYPANRKKLRAWAEKTHAIRYTDGTALYITVRDCKPRERVKEIKGYTSLIEDCAHYNVNSVAACCDAEEAAREVRARLRERANGGVVLGTPQDNAVSK